LTTTTTFELQVRGFSVMPPALCVVMELCNKGSLLDLLKVWVIVGDDSGGRG
jgi:hypothetical protein